MSRERFTEVRPVPSEHSPGANSSRERFPRLKDDIGEDPARFLDRDLFEHGQVRLEERNHAEWDQSRQRLVRNQDVSAPGEMIRDRIRGIDKLAVASAWLAIERRLDRTPEGGRDVVVGLLEDRIDELEAKGERDLPGRSSEELRELGVEAYENSDKVDIVYYGIDGEPTGRSSGKTASQKLAAIADGGEQR